MRNSVNAIAALIALTTACLFNELALAQGLPPRLGHSEPRRVSTFQRPDRLAGTSRRGWTSRSEHFVVSATTSQEDAAQVTQELEQTWAEISRLADQWTTVHRQAAFGLGAVSVVVTREPFRSSRQPLGNDPSASPAPEIFVNLAERSATLDDRLPQMRAETLTSFLQLSGQDRLLPPWVQSGLASYISGVVPPEPAGLRLDLPGPFVAAGNYNQPWRSLSRHGDKDELTPGQSAQAALWVRYLLEGDDAAHADQFFTALATSTTKRSESGFSSTQRARAVPIRPGDPSPKNPLTWETLTRRNIAQADVSDWLADRNVGQPLVQSEPENLALDETHRDLLLILKLARRFATEAGDGVPMRVVERGVDRSAELAQTSAGENVLSVAALYERLVAPGRNRWATLDTDGRLLLSDNKDRLAAIFANPDRNYRTSQRDGHWMVETTLATGETLEGWLEENAAQPKRPIAHLRQKPAAATGERQASL
jgi:hypothetical protein